MAIVDYNQRLLDLKDKEIATLRSKKHKFPVRTASPQENLNPTMHWKTTTDNRGKRNRNKSNTNGF